MSPGRPVNPLPAAQRTVGSVKTPATFWGAAETMGRKLPQPEPRSEHTNIEHTNFRTR